MTCSSDNAARSRGVTLLELLVALAIISLALVLFAPFSSRAIERGAGRRDAELIVAAVRNARADALATGRRIDFVFDADGREYGVAGQPMTHISPAIEMSFTGARELMTSSGAGVLRLYPDGSTSGAVVRIVSERETDQITVDWLTGAAHLEWERPS